MTANPKPPAWPEVTRGTTPPDAGLLITNTYKRPQDDAMLVFAGGKWYEQYVISGNIILKPTANPFNSHPA